MSLEEIDYHGTNGFRVLHSVGGTDPADLRQPAIALVFFVFEFLDNRP